MMVAVLFSMLAILITARNSIGLMMPFWDNDFGWSYGLVSTAGAIMMVVMAMIAPLAGLILDHYGSRLVYVGAVGLIGCEFILCAFMTDYWQLLVLVGIMGGVGFAVISPALVSTTIAQHFDENLGLATSIVTSGSTGGQLALMPLLGLLVVSFSWRASYLFLGVLILLTAIAVFFLIDDTPKTEIKRPKIQPSAIGKTISILRGNSTFWLLAIGFFICCFTTAGVIKIHMIPYAVSCGFSALQSASAYGVMSFFSMVGMIGYGYLSDKMHRPMLLASIYLLRAMTFILLMNITDSPTILFTFSILFGIFDYASFPIVANLVATHIGRKVMGFSMGLIFASNSLGAASGSFLGGYIYDIYASYNYVWIFSVLMAALASFLTLFIKENRPLSAFTATA